MATIQSRDTAALWTGGRHSREATYSWHKHFSILMSMGRVCACKPSHGVFGIVSLRCNAGNRVAYSAKSDYRMRHSRSKTEGRNALERARIFLRLRRRRRDLFFFHFSLILSEHSRQHTCATRTNTRVVYSLVELWEVLKCPDRPVRGYDSVAGGAVQFC